MATNKFENAALFMTLREETDVLRKRHQRKGVEYRVKESGLRPTVSAEGLARLEGKFNLAPTTSRSRPGTVSNAPGAAAKSLNSTAASTGKRGNNETTTDEDMSKTGLSQFQHPSEVAQLELDELMLEVTKRREEASGLHHEVMQLLKRREDLEHETEKLEYEDDIERERKAGLREVESTKARILELEDSIMESEQYRLTLDYMYRRQREQRVEALTLQKAFEQSVHEHEKEYELKQNLLQQVRLSKEEETVALGKLQKDVQAQMQDFDRRIEARKLEIRIYQEKARIRAAKAEHDILLQASTTPITAEEEKLLASKAKEISIQAAEIRATRLRVQAEADSLELQYNSMRFAAGLSGLLPAFKDSMVGKDSAKEPSAIVKVTGSIDSLDSDFDEIDTTTSFPDPDAESLLERFALLESEIKNMENTVADYATRLKALKHRHTYLQVAKQPKARDAKDEFDTDVSKLDTLTRRQEAAKRAAEAAKADAMEAEHIKIHLQQSIDQLMKRLTNLPLPKPEFAEPACSSELDDEVIVQRLLERDAADAPSPWSATVHSNIVQVVAKMRELFRMLHPVEAAAASRAARERIENFRENDRRGTPLNTQSRAASAFDYRLTGFEVDDAMRSDREKMGKMAIVGGERDLDEAIENLVSRTKYGIRVPTKQVGMDTDLPPVKTVKLITEAVHTFEKHLRESVTQTLKDSGADLTKRRTSLKDGKTAKHEGIATEDSKMDDDRSVWNRRSSLVGQATAAIKPKTRELQKMLASALQMSGNEVDDALSGARRETEDVVTRDQIKRATVTQLRQAMKSKKKNELKIESPRPA